MKDSNKFTEIQEHVSEDCLNVLDVINAFGLLENFNLSMVIHYILNAAKKDNPELSIKKALWYLTFEANKIDVAKNSRAKVLEYQGENGSK